MMDILHYDLLEHSPPFQASYGACANCCLTGLCQPWLTGHAAIWPLCGPCLSLRPTLSFEAHSNLERVQP